MHNLYLINGELQCLDCNYRRGVKMVKDPLGFEIVTEIGRKLQEGEDCPHCYSPDFGGLSVSMGLKIDQ